MDTTARGLDQKGNYPMNRIATRNHITPELSRGQTPIFGYLIDQPAHQDLAADFPDGTPAERGNAWALAEAAGIVPRHYESPEERRAREAAEVAGLEANRDREGLWFYAAVATLLALMGAFGLVYVFLTGGPSTAAVAAGLVAIVTGVAGAVASLQLIRRSERESTAR